MFRFSLLLLCNSWLKIYDSEPIQYKYSTEAQTKNCSENLWCDIYLKLWMECSEFLWALNSEKCCDIKLQIHKTWNERTPHKEQSTSNSWLTKYLLARQNIFSHDEISSYSTMANHVRSPISVSIPEAVTQDGVTIYKIHVSLISLYIKMSFNFHD